MSNTKEKLIALKARFVEDFRCGTCPPQNDSCKECILEKETDYLIANGVTISEWIPVTERLPESGVNVLVSCREFDEAIIGWYNSDPEYCEWYGEYKLSEHRDVHVTHWMPLPEPPKGEEHDEL